MGALDRIQSVDYVSSFRDELDQSKRQVYDKLETSEWDKVVSFAVLPGFLKRVLILNGYAYFDENETLRVLNGYEDTLFKWLIIEIFRRAGTPDEELAQTVDALLKSPEIGAKTIASFFVDYRIEQNDVVDLITQWESIGDNVNMTPHNRIEARTSGAETIMQAKKVNWVRSALDFAELDPIAAINISNDDKLNMLGYIKRIFGSNAILTPDELDQILDQLSEERLSA